MYEGVVARDARKVCDALVADIDGAYERIRRFISRRDGRRRVGGDDVVAAAKGIADWRIDDVR
jgi:hypothetical protein